MLLIHPYVFIYIVISFFDKTLESPPDYHTSKQYCKFARHLWRFRLAEGGLAAIGKKIASLTTLAGFRFVPNLQYCFDLRKGRLNGTVVRADFALRELLRGTTD